MGKRKQDQANITHGADNVIKKLRAALGKGSKKSAIAKFKSPQGKTPETKFFDTSFNANVLQAGNVINLNAMVEGTDYNTRIGRKVEMTSVSVDLMFGSAAADLIAAGGNQITGACSYRIALVLDKQPTPATALTYQQVYNNVTSVLTPYQPRLVDNIERFDVLKVWEGTIDTANKLSERIQGYIKLNQESRYNATNGGTFADLTTNSLFLVSATDQAVTEGNYPSISGVIRLRFRDM